MVVFHRYPEYIYQDLVKETCRCPRVRRVGKLGPHVIHAVNPFSCPKVDSASFTPLIYLIYCGLYPSVCIFLLGLPSGFPAALMCNPFR